MRHTPQTGSTAHVASSQTGLAMHAFADCVARRQAADSMRRARSLVPPAAVRIAAGLAAALVTALFLRALELPPPPAAASRRGEPVAILLPRVAPTPAPPVQTLPAPRKSPPQPPSVALVPPPSVPLQQSHDAAKLPAAPATAGAAIAPPAAASAPAPLVIDAKLLRSAARSAASPVRHMAAAAGVELESPPKSVGQTHAEAIGRSAKSGYLDPNENASLLSAFVIA